MSHPEFIEIDGKKVSTLDVMLMPCKTKKDLQNWIRTFLVWICPTVSSVRSPALPP